MRRAPPEVGERSFASPAQKYLAVHTGSHKGGTIMATIPITKVTGGPSGSNLIKCYFDLVSTTPTRYDFCAPSGSVLASGVESSKAFNVSKFRGFDWTITANLPGGTATGDWKSIIHVGPFPSPTPVPGEEEGTFQAQAGGHGTPPPESASSASA